MANAQSNVTVNINANTADLDAKLAKQEAQIKTLDGAINLLGGSVELAASAMVGLGLASEENAKEFEATALAAIAFADGSKRVLDGVKSLNEGLKAYGGVAGVAKNATSALFNVIKANPYVAAATAVAGLAVAIYAYVTATDKAEEAEKRRIATELQGINQRALAISREERLAQARGESIENLAELRKKTMELRLEEIKLERQRLQGPGGKNVLENQEEINKLGDEYLKLQTEIEALEIETARKVKERNDKAAADEKARLDKEEADRKAAADKAERDRKSAAEKKQKERDDELAAEKKFLDDSLKEQQDYTKKLNEEFEQRKADRQALADYEHDLLMEEFQAVIDDLEERKKAGEEAAAAEASLLQAQLQLTQAVGDGVANLGALFKQGTAAAKAAAIADIAINTAIGFVQGLDIAQKSAKATGPAAAFAFPIFYASQIAAVLGAVASAKQVLAQTPGGGGNIVTTQPAGAIGSGTPRINRPDLSGQFGQGGFLAPGAGGTPILAPQQPIQAYVLASDVTTGLQAYGQISRRRRFG